MFESVRNPRKISDLSENLEKLNEYDQSNKENDVISSYFDLYQNAPKEHQEILARLKEGIQIKLNSNINYKNRKYLEARNGYLKALEYFKINDEKYSKLLSLSSLSEVINECIRNIAICSLILKDYESTILYTNEILKLNHPDFTTLYLKAKALMYLDRRSEAIIVIKKALTFNQNKSLLDYLKKYDNVSTIIEENILSDYTENGNKPPEIVKSEGGDNQQTELRTNWLKSTYATFWKIIKIIFYSWSKFVGNNKVLFVILMSVIIYYFKMNIENILMQFLSFVKF